MDKKSCQCCLKGGVKIDKESGVNRQQQQTFFDFFGDELGDGFVCLKCRTYLELFQNFKSEIQALRLSSRQTTKAQLFENEFVEIKIEKEALEEEPALEFSFVDDGYSDVDSDSDGRQSSNHCYAQESQWKEMTPEVTVNTKKEKDSDHENDKDDRRQTSNPCISQKGPQKEMTPKVTVKTLEEKDSEPDSDNDYQDYNVDRQTFDQKNMRKEMALKLARDSAKYEEEETATIKSPLMPLLKKCNVKFLDGETPNENRKLKDCKISCPKCKKVMKAKSFRIHFQLHQGVDLNKFMCEICSKKYRTNSMLKMHLRTHTKEKPFKCDHCPNLAFSCRRSVIRHISNIHLKQPRKDIVQQKCKLCYKKLSSRSLLLAHIKTVHPNGYNDDVKVDRKTGKYHCVKCGGRYKTRHFYDIHSCSIKTNKKVNEEISDDKGQESSCSSDVESPKQYEPEFTKELEAFLIHDFSEEIDKPAESGNGSKLASLLQKYDVQYLEDKTDKSGKSPKIICPICDKVMRACSFPIHLKLHQGGREYKFMCELCSKKFICNADLVIHHRSHTKEKPFKCDLCPTKSFTCKKNVLRHFQSIHLKKKLRDFVPETCKLCDKTLKNGYVLATHMKKVHPNGINDGLKVNPITGQYHCETCESQYTTKYHYNNHNCLTGANDKSNQNRCLICFAHCASRSKNLKHIQTVHAERIDGTKWKCLICNAIVLEKIVLHIESVHTTENSTCTICNKDLKNRRCLRNHIFLVHENGSEIRKQKRKTKKLLLKTEQH